MRIRYIDKRTGTVDVHDAGRDMSYRLFAGQFTVSYAIERKNSTGRKVRMHRTLNAQSKKAAEIRAILESSE